LHISQYKKENSKEHFWHVNFMNSSISICIETSLLLFLLKMLKFIGIIQLGQKISLSEVKEGD
jgi:hypothetical protein